MISAGSVKVRKDDRLTLVEAASLRITRVDVADAGDSVATPCSDISVLSLPNLGNYTCEVEWSGHPKQIVHTLAVHVPPQIEAILPGSGYPPGLVAPGFVDRPVEAREGSSVRLECRADGIPTPTIRWRKRVGLVRTDVMHSALYVRTYRVDHVNLHQVATLSRTPRSAAKRSTPPSLWCAGRRRW